MRLAKWMSVAMVAAAALMGGQAIAADAGKVTIQWYGQSATKVTTPSGKVILIDPWLTKNPATPAEYKNLDAIGKVDVILVTHAHGDHLGDGPDLAKKLNVPLYGPAGLNQQLVTLGVLPVNLAPRMNKGGSIMPFGNEVKITQVHAEHSSELLWNNPATTKDETHVGGEPVGLILQFSNGFTMYHMGDTGLFGDMKFIGEHYKPTLVMIPIGGNFVMDPKDAAFATTQWLKPKYAIPFHYGTNPLLKGTPAEYIQAVGKAPVKVFDMKPGQEMAFVN